MTQFIDEFLEIVQWVHDIYAQKPQPPGGCPVGHIGPLGPPSNADRPTMLLNMAALKLYDCYLERVDGDKAYAKRN